MANPTTPELSAHHLTELVEGSAIDPEVIRERGYVTVGRPNAALQDAYGRDTREQLRAMGFPSWATREDYFYPGLLIPQYSPSGRRYAGQFKPHRPVPGKDGKPQKYASARGAARLDVHPRWTTLGGELIPPIQDPARRLWITEGVKKADSLTSRGEVTVALAGVYNWRNTHATLGDWEDVQLKREIIVCFDADAISKPAVAQAMARLGRWLKHKGATKLWYLVVPAMVNDAGVKGVDDWFAAGGTLKGLEQAFETRPPEVIDTQDRFTDARLAETLSTEVLDGRYAWAAGMGWLMFDGSVWAEATEVTATETVRTWALDHFADAAGRVRENEKSAMAEVDGWRALLGASRNAAVLKLSRGLVERKAADFDADSDHLNTQSGYLNLDTGEVRQTGPDEFPTKITGARFNPDATSPLFDKFLARILPDADVRDFVQRLLGYALLGEVREHVMPIFIGEGANGKGTLRDAVLAAMGTYAIEVDPEILMASHNPRHGTFILELMGRRLVFCSETQKGRRFADAQMRRLVGGDPLQGNRMRENPITFIPSHTMIMCSNHLPKVDDDEANWRRLLVVPFDVIIPEAERDGRLPRKLQEPEAQDAILAWMYAGYRAYLEQGLNPPEAVRVRTAAYRAENDLMGQFVEECLSFTDPTAKTTLAALSSRYVEWFRANAGKDDVPLSGAELNRALTKRGRPGTKSKVGIVFRGVEIIRPVTRDEGWTPPELGG